MKLGQFGFFTWTGMELRQFRCIEWKNKLLFSSQDALKRCITFLSIRKSHDLKIVILEL